MTKVDRASMSQSLEVRCPFLDHDFIEYVWSIPSKYKVKGNTGKWILRKALCEKVPKKLLSKSKQGFEIPLGSLLRGPLKDWAESLLNSSDIKCNGLLRKDFVDILWTNHLEGKRDESKKLWNILMLQSWLINQ